MGGYDMYQGISKMCNQDPKSKDISDLITTCSKEMESVEDEIRNFRKQMETYENTRVKMRTWALGKRQRVREWNELNRDYPVPEYLKEYLSDVQQEDNPTLNFAIS